MNILIKTNDYYWNDVILLCIYDYKSNFYLNNISYNIFFITPLLSKEKNYLKFDETST